MPPPAPAKGGTGTVVVGSLEPAEVLRALAMAEAQLVQSNLRIAKLQQAMLRTEALAEGISHRDELMRY